MFSRYFYYTRIWNEIKSSKLPGIAMPFLMACGSLRDHFCTSSFIFWILLGFMAHKQPFLWLPLEAGFSIFSKHLFKLKLCRTEFFHPLGAFLKYGKCSLKSKRKKFSSLHHSTVGKIVDF